MIDNKDVRAQATSSLWSYQQLLWQYLGWYRYHPLGWLDELMAYHAEHDRLGGKLANRSYGKTHAVYAEAFYRWEKDPNEKIMLVSKSIGHSRKMANEIRNLIDRVPWLKKFQPRQERGWRDTRDRFDIGACTPTTQASLEVYGIESQLPGNRASLVIADDIETQKNTITAESREDLRDKTSEFRNIATYGGQRVHVVGTPHHQESVYQSLIERGYEIYSYPLLYPKHDEKVLNMHPELQERLDKGKVRPGDIVADYRFTPHYVADKRAEGPIIFAMQQMMIADLADAARYPLRLENLIVYDFDHRKAPTFMAWGKNNGQGTSTCRQDIVSVGFGSDRFYGPIMVSNEVSEWAEFNKMVMTIDPAGRGGDETAWCVCGGLAGMAWWLDVGGSTDPWGTSQMLQLIRLGHRYEVREFWIERNYGGDPAIELFKSELSRYCRTEQATLSDGATPWGAMVHDYHSTGQKEMRIADTLEPAVASHRIVAHSRVAEDRDFQMQLTRLTRERNALKGVGDDRIEAAAKAVEVVQKGFQDDPETARQRAKDAIADAYREARYKRLGIEPPSIMFFKP